MKELGALLGIAAASVVAGAVHDAITVDGDYERVKHILVYGSAGVGKTSFVNALSGESIPTSGGARGVTLKSQEVVTRRDGVDYRVIDTAGLDEAHRGAVSSAGAVGALVRLLKRSKDGLNLMVIVVKKGRIHASTLNNFELFVKKMGGKKVPLLIIVTHCEREDGDMQGWVDVNGRDFISRGIIFTRMVATTFMTPDLQFDNVEHMQAKVNQSIELSWGAIQACATDTPVDFMKEKGGFIGVLRDMYNSVARRFSEKAIWVSEPLVKMAEKLTPAGVSRNEIYERAREACFFDG